LPFDHDEVVAVAVLTNGVEDTALLIPSTPFGAGPYTFTWAIDRPRHRSAVVDDTVRYRASAVMNLTIGTL